MGGVWIFSGMAQFDEKLKCGWMKTSEDTDGGQVWTDESLELAEIPDVGY